MSTVPLGARLIDAVIDRGVLPDPVLRTAIRRLLRRRRATITAGSIEDRDARKRALLASLATSPVAIDTAEANEQHYEVPTELFELMLGPHLKYSSAHWPIGVSTLAQAEEAMLALTCARAELADGQDVLELGCGWGSLTLWMAARYPASRITAVSNSATQREHIEKQAALRGLDNVRVLTCDVNRLGAGAGEDGGDGAYAEVVHPEAFDRVVSVEMFEHVRNHRVLTQRIARWLRPGGALFVHVFAHATDPYPFDTGGNADWMARHFFTGGLMPSHDLLVMSVQDLAVEDRWAVSGIHYARSLRAWLDRLDANATRCIDLLDDAGGPVSGRAAFQRWRVFTIACEELFAFAGGDEWHVSHVRFRRAA
ncbi:MAG: class I SAM-dependent methyltransferase [Nitriliruptoraceae bacterium]|nr:class I SAM-dependent methyltransferase [Nitriliruptoraceae bacterium]